MASSLSPSANPLLGHAILEKLSKNNHLLWKKTQVLPIVRGARLEGHLTGDSKPPATELDAKVDGKETKIVNPAYEAWMATDQQVLGFILSSMTKEVLQQVTSFTTVASAWKILAESYGSVTCSRVVNTRIALATTHKGAMSVTEYVAKMRALSNEMNAAGKPLGDEDLVSYILAGLDIEFNSV